MRAWHGGLLLLALLLLMMTLLGAGEVRALERVDATDVGAGIPHARRVLVSDDGRWAYVVTSTTPTRPAPLIKIDLATLQPVAEIDYATDVDSADGAIGLIDPLGTRLYVVYTSLLGARIARVDLTTMQLTGTGQIGDYPQTFVIDAMGRYGYTSSDEGGVDKIDLTTLQVVGHLQTGLTFLQSAVIDPSDRYLYLGTLTAPANVARIDLNTFQWAGMITFPAHVVAFRSAVMAPDGSAAYFGTYSNPNFTPYVAKVDLASFQPGPVLHMGIDSVGLGAAAIDTAGRYAYFGTSTKPARLLKVDLATFAVADSLVLDGDDNGVLSVALDAGGDYAYAGTLDAPGQVIKVALRDPPPDRLRFSPADVDFQMVRIGSLATRTVTLDNAGTRAATGLAFTAAAPDVSVDSSACGATLAAGASCQIVLTYAPGATGALADSWGASSLEGATAHLAVLGSAVSPPQGATVSEDALDFGAVDIGATSAPRTFTVTNTGSASAMFVMIYTDAPGFLVDATACDFIAAGASCPITVRYTPIAVSPVSTTLHISSSSPVIEADVGLSGRGVLRDPAVRFVENSVDFGQTPVGGIGRRMVQLRNIGASLLTDLDFSSSDPAFRVSSETECPWLLGGQVCVVDLEFTPGAQGPASTTITLTTAQGAMAQIPVSGTGSGNGQPAALVFEPASLAFGNVATGTIATRTVTLRNTGSGFAQISHFMVLPWFEADGMPCMPMLGPGESCTVEVRFAPIGPGPQNETLMVMTDQGVGAELPLSGTGRTEAIFQNGFD
ncbi:MAG TPA: choice-of-anchor D domain-containing protein [Dokdonella sp.]|uniref:choice-of-anchor D domain-containing protein n=1 Tax=Dokdonella sp. TaxID=2291710 RepID=UPI002C7AD101|nr:choice-of-anchor D domain-containing protein [Dokdonella sp.]HUD42899.1 choice-of-anchor D domain-containing protein [Dokdonella sp.]